MKFMFFRFIKIIIVVSLCTGCGSQSLNDYRDQGHATTRSLIKEMQAIYDYEELIERRSYLTTLFSDLVDTMNSADQYRQKNPNAELSELSEVDHQLSDALRAEMNRLYRIEGVREIIESCQRDALKKHLSS